jgi:hypothetical protein
VLDVRKKIAPSKRVTLRPISKISSGLKKHFWGDVNRMQTAVGCSRNILTETAKLQLIGVRRMMLMEPIMVITAQLLLVTLQISRVGLFTRHQNRLSKLHAMMTNQDTH